MFIFRLNSSIKFCKMTKVYNHLSEDFLEILLTRERFLEILFYKRDDQGFLKILMVDLSEDLLTQEMAKVSDKY